MRHRQISCLSFIFLLLSSLYLPACSITLQSKQNPLESQFLSKNPFQVIQSFGFTELLEKNFKESPTQTVANLFAYYIDGRVLQNFVAAIFDRSKQSNLLSYQSLATILADEGLTNLNTERIIELFDLEDSSQVDFTRFSTMSNVLFNEALTLVTYIYIMDKEKMTNFNVGLDLETIEHYILKIFHKLENIYPAPRCEDLEYLFYQSDKDEDGRLSVQEFHYLLSIFLKYYRTGIRNNEYAAIIFKDDMFGDLFEKAEEAEKEHLEQTDWTKGSFYTFLSMALHEDLLNQVGHVLFNKFDTSGDGLISPEEFFTLLGMFGGTEEEIQLIFAATDSNSDGSIDFAEFLVALETLSRRLAATFGTEYFELIQEPVSLDNVWGLFKGENPEDLELISFSEVEGLYRAYDVDKNGDLDEDEFRNFLSELITYLKKKIDARDDKDMDEIVGLEANEENIEQVNDDKQDEKTDDAGDNDAGDIIDIITAEESKTEVTEPTISDDITHEETESSEPIATGDDVTEETEATGEDLTEKTLATESEPASEGEVTESEPVPSGEVTEDTGVHEETEATRSELPSSAKETESDVTVDGEVTESEPVVKEETEATKSERVTDGEETKSDVTESDASDKEEETTKSAVKEKTDSEPTKETVATDSDASDASDKEEESTKSTGSESESKKTQDTTTTTSDTSKTQDTTTPTTSDTSKTQDTTTPTTPTTPVTPVTPEPPKKKVLKFQQADFNGDGLADFLRRPTSVSDQSNSQVFLSNGDGTFKIVKLTDSYNIPADLTDVYIGDFNGDGKTDLFRREKGSWANDKVNTAFIYFSNGDGTFRTVGIPEKYGVDGNNYELSFGDFNGDGKTDFISQQKGSTSVQQATVYLSNGDGTFGTSSVGDGASPIPADLTNLVVGDFNGDGKSDFIRQEKGSWASDNVNSATLFTSTGNGNFKAVTLPSNLDIKGNNVKLFVGDFDGDGIDDFLSQVHSSGTLNSGSSTPGLFISDGKGGFTFQSLKGTIPAGDQSLVYLGNFDGDQKADFIVQYNSINANPQGYAYLNSQTSPSIGFSAYSFNDYNIPRDLTNLFIGDFNGDGKDDVLRQEKGSWANDNVNTANVFFSSCEAQNTVSKSTTNARSVFKLVELPSNYNIGGNSASLVNANPTGK